MVGLPKSYIKKWGITKLAWTKFRAKVLSKSRSKKTKTTRRKNNPKPKRRRRNLARRKKRRSSPMTIPLAPTLALANVVVPGIQQIMGGDLEGGVKRLKEDVTCFDDNGFRADLAMKNWGGLVAGLLVHKFIGGSPLNLNRILARAKVPFIRI